ncbi:MAG: endonuclease domain-containing protein [Candidatus Levybacteria bacterium]|nr:endonuclease domain-containing protein [Candidatus Levybacteria bacterium]
MRVKKTVEKINFARSLRVHQTDVEKLLWAKLRDKRFMGIKFRRQQVIGSYIVDFVSFKNKLIIELDGGQHNSELGKRKDVVRTEWLSNEGFHILRFWNKELLENIEGALTMIQDALSNPSPNPLPQRGEGYKEGTIL